MPSLVTEKVTSQFENKFGTILAFMPKPCHKLTNLVFSWAGVFCWLDIFIFLSSLGDFASHHKKMFSSITCHAALAHYLLIFGNKPKTKITMKKSTPYSQIRTFSHTPFWAQQRIKNKSIHQKPRFVYKKVMISADSNTLSNTVLCVRGKVEKKSHDILLFQLIVANSNVFEIVVSTEPLDREKKKRHR